MSKIMFLQYPLQTVKDHEALCAFQSSQRWAKIRINSHYPLLGSSDFHLYDLGGK